MAELKITPGPWVWHVDRSGDTDALHAPEDSILYAVADDPYVSAWLEIDNPSDRVAIPAVPFYENLRKATIALRRAQQAYMADRGNNEKGAAVAARAADVDEALEMLNAALEVNGG